jgi:hypothetical protein
MTFDGENLFDSGPNQLHIGPIALRHATQATLDSEGATIAAQGLQARPMVQRGTLLADVIGDLHEQRAAIEAKLDGLPHELVDRFGQVWSQVMMVRFAPEAPRRLGPRWQMPYRIDYEQLLP